MLGGRNHRCDREDSSVLSKRGDVRQGVGLAEREHTITATKAGGHDGDLGLALLGGP